MKFVFFADALREGKSLRFVLDDGTEGFALRDRSGTMRGYLNVCAHRGQPVDLGDGKIFTRDGAIECQAHGALFDPATGICVGGPCPGQSLKPLPLIERDRRVWLQDDE